MPIDQSIATLFIVDGDGCAFSPCLTFLPSALSNGVALIDS